MNKERNSTDRRLFIRTHHVYSKSLQFGFFGSIVEILFADIMSNHNVKFGQFCRGTASGDVLARFDHKYCHVASHLDH